MIQIISQWVLPVIIGMAIAVILQRLVLFCPGEFLFHGANPRIRRQTTDGSDTCPSSGETEGYHRVLFPGVRDGDD